MHELGQLGQLDFLILESFFQVLFEAFSSLILHGEVIFFPTSLVHECRWYPREWDGFWLPGSIAPQENQWCNLPLQAPEWPWRYFAAPFRMDSFWRLGSIGPTMLPVLLSLPDQFPVKVCLQEVHKTQVRIKNLQ